MKIAATMVGMDAAHTYMEVALRSAGPLYGQPTSSRSFRSDNFGERFSTLISSLESSSQATSAGEVGGAPPAEPEAAAREPQENQQLVSQLTGTLTGHSVSVNAVSSSFSTSVFRGNEGQKMKKIGYTFSNRPS